MKAQDVIRDAMEHLNRLSPGETLGADDSDLGFRRLNRLVDELSVRRAFLFKDILTSSTQTGHITLGASPWTAIPVGAKIAGITQDGYSVTRIDYAQYSLITDPTTNGAPVNWAHDGNATVKMYPVPNGQTIQIHTRDTVTTFADLNTTDYTTIPGMQSYLGAALAVRLAPALVGAVPAGVASLARSLEIAVGGYKPPIINASGFGTAVRSNILQGV